VRRVGTLIFSDKIEGIVSELDDALFLENERFFNEKKRIIDEYISSPLRPPFHSGTAYPSEERELRRIMDKIIGEGEYCAEDIFGLVVPHIDIERGKLSYGQAYRLLKSKKDYELIVIIGTSHFSETDELIITTMKDYDTPFGALNTDKELVEALNIKCGLDLAKNEHFHRSEHSIEFQTIFLKYIYPGGNFKILPVLAGGFGNFIERYNEKKEFPDDRVLNAFISKMVDIAKEKRTLFIAAADLSHIGPRFGDNERPGIANLELLEARDRVLLTEVERLEANNMFEIIAEEQDRRRICGLPPIYILLKILSGIGCSNLEGRVLKYEYDFNTIDASAVSFASVGFFNFS